MENNIEKPEGIELPESLALARELENTEDEVVIKEKLGDLLEKITQDLQTEFTFDIGSIYKGMQSENCLARVESLSRVLETMGLDQPLSIADENETHYANAVLPNSEGIKIAFSEGQAPGAVRTVVGFGKTIIGFKTDTISVSEIDFNESEIRDSVERKFLCRHVSGNLNKKDIRYMVMRIPLALMPERHLNDEEKKRNGPFVFRGMKF